MSRSFLGFGQVPYIGVPYSTPIKLAGIAGIQVPLLFQWLSYGASTSKPNINVLVDCDIANLRSLDQIRSVYIDNLGSDTPIYVYFPDTGYTITAKPNSEGWYPAFTNAKKIWVIGLGFLTGDIPSSYVILCNIPLPPSVNTEIDNAVALFKASPTITRGTTLYNSNYGVPALGDQLFSSARLDLSTVGNTVNLFNTPYSKGFLYLTYLAIIVTYIAQPPGGSQGYCIVNLESTGVGGTLITPRFNTSPPPSFGPNPQSIAGQVQLNGLQTKLDATQTWRARVTSNAGVGDAQIYASFTQGNI